VKRAIASLLLATGAVLANTASVSAAPISICGNLDRLTRNVPPETPGSATIDGRTFLLTSALSPNQTNRVDADVRAGQRACLTGDLVNAPSPAGAVELVQNFVLSSCAGRSDPGCAPNLPSTATSQDPASPFVALAEEEPGHLLRDARTPGMWASDPVPAGSVIAILAGVAVLLRRRPVSRT
jgi:hypothetical protein